MNTSLRREERESYSKDTMRGGGRMRCRALIGSSIVWLYRSYIKYISRRGVVCSLQSRVVRVWI